MEKTMLRISGMLFFIFSALNFMRFIGEFPLQVGSYDVPLNMSLAMSAVSFVLAWLMLRATR